ncbi:hypothetical protein CMUS01_10395 [Colletotrichum musicola]|uniref:Uncharacterized protein n=1 Tax=Colletotrichum musicola TaxID=2175873 RepID=A0A8H6K3M4_9PEZI|nr:hypothetical protein CMUS01_10395 [Colletotrichum musicola]
MDDKLTQLSLNDPLLAVLIRRLLTFSHLATSEITGYQLEILPSIRANKNPKSIAPHEMKRPVPTVAAKPRLLMGPHAIEGFSPNHQLTAGRRVLEAS